MGNDFIQKTRAKAAATRYRHPAKALRVIVVTGPYGKTTTALLLSELLQEAGHKVMVLTNRGSSVNGEEYKTGYDTAQGFQRALAYAKKKSADFVVVESSPALLRSHALSTVVLEMSVLTGVDEIAKAVFDMPVAYTVVPSGVDIESLSVAPHQAISYGQDDLAEAKLQKVTLYRRGTELELVIDHQTTLQLATHLVGGANARNVAAAVAAAYVLAVDTSTFEEGIARLEYVPGNFDYSSDGRPYTVVVDGACTKESVELVLEAAKKLAKRRVLVALDASVPTDAYDSAKRLADRVSVVSDQDEQPGLSVFASEKETADTTLRGAKLDDMVLLLGSEFARLESEHLTVGQRLLEVERE